MYMYMRDLYTIPADTGLLGTMMGLYTLHVRLGIIPYLGHRTMYYFPKQFLLNPNSSPRILIWNIPKILCPTLSAHTTKCQPTVTFRRWGILMIGACITHMKGLTYKCTCALLVTFMYIYMYMYLKNQNTHTCREPVPHYTCRYMQFKR